MGPTARWLAIAALGVTFARGAFAGEPEPPGEPGPLVSRSDLTQAHLPNGVTLWILPRPESAGRVSMWLRIGTGSLNEGERERGLAHFAEHMGFNGTEHFAPGALVDAWQRLGLRFGPDLNAATNYRDTVYQVALPDGKPDTIALALRTLGDLAFRRVTTDVEVERERDVILEELLSDDGPDERVARALVPALLPGSRLPLRRPGGLPAVVRGARAADIDGYIERWYRPERTQVLVVGDVDGAALRAQAARELGAWQPAGEASESFTAGVRAYPRPSAAVVSDPELREVTLRLQTIVPARPLRTRADYRGRLVEDLAVRAFDERLETLVDNGAPFASASVDISPARQGLIDRAYVDASASPGRWRGALGAVVTAVNRVRRQGFDADEIADAVQARLGDARHEAASEPGRPIRALLDDMRAALNEDRPLLSAAQRLSLDEELAPGITGDEIAAAFARWFAPEHRLLTLVGPPGFAPREASLLAFMSRIESPGAPAPTPWIASPRVDKLLDDEPVVGEVARETHDDASGVDTLAFTNGVEAHILPLAQEPGQARVELVLEGGELRETAARRGLTEAATVAFNTPASDRLNPAAIRRHLIGRAIDLSACACTTDALSVRLSTSAGDLEKGLRLLHLLLVRGRVAAGPFAAWKDGRRAVIEAERADPEARLDAEVDSLLAGGDVRAQPLTAAELDRITLPAAQAWLDKHLQSAPIEVALVGDLPRETLRALATRYLGSLPARPAGDAQLAALRAPLGHHGPHSAAPLVDTITPRAAVALAWRGPERTQVRDRELLAIAGAWLTDGLTEAMREREAVTYAVRWKTRLASGLRGTGRVGLSFSTDARRVTSAGALARKVVGALVARGPSAAELETARHQVAHAMAADRRALRTWASFLAGLDYRGLHLDEMTQAPTRLFDYQAADVTETLRRYLVPERGFAVVAAPRLVVARNGAIAR